MENQDPRSHVRLVASIVLLVVIGASLIGAAYLRTNPAAVSTSTITTTKLSTTVTKSITVTAPSNSTTSLLSHSNYDDGS